jgi:cell division ATPase FtsA
MAEAERIKNIYGGVMSTEADANEKIFLDPKDENNIVTKARVIDIIQARVDEIIQIIQDKIIASKAKISNIVITGGVARTLKLKDLISAKLGAKVRIGYPHNPELLKDNEKNSLELVTSIGALKHISENIINSNSTCEPSKDTSIVNNLLTWIRNTFF